MHGRCTCGEVEFELTAAPIVVHCCHCTWCQRETGSAFALNLCVESDQVVQRKGAVEEVTTPSNSGKGQIVMRCPNCQIALWSHYAGSGRAIAYVRVGALDDPAASPPDMHIFTSTKLPWVPISKDVRAFEGFYSPKEEWSAEAMARFIAVKAKEG